MANKPIAAPTFGQLNSKDLPTFANAVKGILFTLSNFMQTVAHILSKTVTTDGAGTMDNVFHFAPGVQLAAAATTDLTSVASNHVLITGAGATITSLGTPYNGAVFFIKFNGINTIKQGATIQLPGSVDYVTANNTAMIFAAFSTSLWRCMSVVAP